MSSSDQSTAKPPRPRRSSLRGIRTSSVPSASALLLQEPSKSPTDHVAHQKSSNGDPIDVEQSTFVRGPEPRRAPPRAILGSTASQSSTYTTSIPARDAQSPQLVPTAPAGRFDSLVQALDRVEPPSASAELWHAGTVAHATPTTSRSLVGSPYAARTGTYDDAQEFAKAGRQLRHTPSIPATATAARAETPLYSGHMAVVAFPRTNSARSYRGDNEPTLPLPTYSRPSSNSRSRPISDAFDRSSSGQTLRSDSAWDYRSKEMSPDLEAQARAREMGLIEAHLAAIDARKRTRSLTPGIICMQYILPLVFLGVIAVIILALVKYR